MRQDIPITRELVLVGGGHTHALVLRMWGMNPLPGARVTVINPAPTAAYTGMLPGYVAGHYGRDDLDIDLVRLARFAGARVILERAEAIDPNTKRVRLTSGRQIAFDVCSVDVGITSDLPQLPGFSEFGVAAKPLDIFAARWAGFIEQVRAGKAPPQVCVLGGGLGGVELALAAKHALTGASDEAPEVALVDLQKVGSALPGRAQGKLRSTLARRGVRVIEGARADRLTSDTVELSNGASLPTAFTITTAGARPHVWLGESGLDLKDGFIAIDRHLRTSARDIFAAGDCAVFTDRPLPKAGVFAVRQAPVLFRNLRTALSGRGTLTPYRPQMDFLKLIALGERSALATKWGLSASGPALWRWKDHIDRKFMDRFADLTPMQPPELPRERAEGVARAMGDKPFCGGCGSKVGGGALAKVLGPSAPLSDKILSVPGDDAAILRLGHGRFQIQTTDHLRVFTEDPALMARITALHALGDIWAMGATPQTALASVILPRLSKDLQQSWLQEIMEAARAVFTEAGAEIVGGHTTMGSELTLGFAVTGIADKTPITLAGAKPGDRLILTRPIGSGTVLAAEMQMKARGQDVAEVLQVMAQSQADAAAKLSHAHAMTDVTGFGLAGHLLNILHASGVGAELDLAAIPLLPGARALTASGIRSTIYSDNRELWVGSPLPDTPEAALLFDPQTAGPLLAAIPADSAKATLGAIREIGHAAALVGTITEGAPAITLC